MADAAFDNESSFQTARDELKRQLETLFSNGVVEGRRLQLIDDGAELREAREEIILIRARLEVAQAEHEPSKQRMEDVDVGGPSWVSHPKHSKSSFVNGVGEDWMGNEAHQRNVQSGRSPSPVGSSLSDTSFVTPSAVTDELETSSARSAGNKRRTCSSPVLTLPTALTILPQTRSLQHDGMASSPATNQGCSEPDTDQTVQSPGAAPWQTVGDTPIRTPKYIKQLDKLLKAANTPGHIEHYKKVKALCTEAHFAKDQKTDLQRYLLVKWKTPDWVKGSQSSSNTVRTDPSPPTNPLSDDPPEAWVAYYTAFPASCPLGVRRDSDGKPRLADMRASRIMARLRPDMMLDEQTTRAARMQFKEIAIRHLFSVPGRYRRVLTNNNTVIAPQVTYQPFMGRPGDITIIKVALHFAKCGISTAVVDSDLEPWAEECVGIWNEAGWV